MHSIKIQYVKTPYGELVVGALDGRLCLSDWRYRKKRAEVDARITKGLKAHFIEESDVVIEEAISQLNAYFCQKRQVFDLPLLMVGTAFQKNVWQHLTRIPFGQTISYSELADNMGCPKAVRAVANANGANALSIFVPCHRVIGRDGRLVGYAGGTRAKEALLRCECDFFGRE